MGLAELALLGHLIGDGCTLPRHTIQYTTNDESLAQTVADLALEVFGDKIRPRITKERDWYQVYLAAATRLTHGVHNPIASWLNSLGAFGLRSFDKRVPAQVFEQPAGHIAHFLRHLWSTDGSIHLSHGSGHYVNVYFATSSQLLAIDVQRLLLRIGINAAIGRHAQPNKGRDQFHVSLRGRSDIEWFLREVGAIGTLKVQHKAAIAQYFSSRMLRTRDFLPMGIWQAVALPALEAVGVSRAALGSALGARPHYDRDVGRELAGRVAVIASSEELARLADSDVLWDRVISIEDDGDSDVFDLTVDGVHNFVAADMVLHNSLEQDSDLVLFIYRDRFYNDNVAEDRRNIAEIIIAKHRNGPTGKLELLFIDEQTKFANLDRAHGR
jgi:replicative DNA helicase